MRKYILLFILPVMLLVLSAFSPDRSVGIKQLVPSEKKDLDSKRDGVHVDDIYVACRYYFSKVFSTRENISRKNICNGYFFGSASMLLLLQDEGRDTNTCVPMDISTEELIRGFIKWADDNEGKRKMLASEALLELFRSSYPCDNGYKPKDKEGSAK